MSQKFVMRICSCLLFGLAVLDGAAAARADAGFGGLEAARRATGFVFTDSAKTLSMDTAFCIDTSGLFVTSDRVVSDKGNVDRIRIVLSPGTPDARVLDATVLKSDADLDVAILRVDRPGVLHSVELAGAGRLERLGETQEVMALGYPVGVELASPESAPEVSVSTGKITALRHERGQLAGIQFDGSINHGNTGGPLIDKYGNVIGVVTTIVPDKQSNFAIPVSAVRAVLSEANVVIVPPMLEDAALDKSFIDALVAPPAGRIAVPSQPRQEATRKLTHQLFASAYGDKSKAGKQNLPYVLLDAAEKETHNPVGRYVLLSDSRAAALDAGDITASVATSLELTAKYDVSSLDLLSDLIKRLGSRRRNTTSRWSTPDTPRTAR